MAGGAVGGGVYLYEKHITPGTQLVQDTVVPNAPVTENSIVADTTSGPAPFTVGVHTSKGGAALKGYVDFGDNSGQVDLYGGNSCSPTSCSAQHTYTQPGTYAIRLLDTGKLACNVDVQSSCEQVLTSHTLASVTVVVTANTSAVVITAPSAGAILLADKITTVKWSAPQAVIDSFPADFNLILFLYVQNPLIPGVNIAGIGDGNSFAAGSTQWDIPGAIAHHQFNPGSYKIVWQLQAMPKDPARMCAVRQGGECAPSVVDSAVMQKAAKMHGETGQFSIVYNNPG
ncbi:MAG: hypothetical protein V4474_04255 [Patescibacteria group bacterium]